MDVGCADEKKPCVTRFFEQYLDWTGVHAAAGQLNSICEEQNLPRVDLCVVATKGTELDCIQGLDVARFNISVLSIANCSADPRIREKMVQLGYEPLARLGEDEIYKRKDLSLCAQTTVFCAVWHGETALESLLHGHMTNLDKQTVPIERIYVIDGNIPAPEWLTGKVITVREATTIYEAWNIALATVETPLVMNLNLDDRLAPDAIDVMERALAQTNYELIGADWRICFSQEQNDAVEPVRQATEIPCDNVWPPKPDMLTRLGSGTGERDTLGPACLWRSDLHLQHPRFPWRFGDLSKVRTIGDALWWSILEHQNKKLGRLPLIIGNYLSHPENQAEFRHPAPDERRILRQVGISDL